MPIQEHVRLCILNYPSIFSNALDVYDHLFYTIGNGYEWKNGELVHIGGNNFEAHTIAEAIANEVDKNIKFARREKVFLDGVYQFSVDYMCKNIHTIMEVDKRVNDFSPSADFSFYPISQYSKCLNIPKDIKPDWLEAINKLNEIKEKLC